MNTEMSSKNVRTGQFFLSLGRVMLIIAFAQAMTRWLDMHPTWLSISLTALGAMMLQSIGTGMVARG